MAVVADAVPEFRLLGFKDTISAFIAVPSFEEWARRLESHLMSSDQLQRRYSEAMRSLTFVLNDDRTHFVLNDKVDEAVRQLKNIANGKVDFYREEAARQAAHSMIDGINYLDAGKSTSGTTQKSP
jgi:guanylate kinase